MCNINDILNGISEEDLKELIFDYDIFMEFYHKYNGTSNNEANQLLNEVLKQEEKDYLYQLLVSPSGWYCKIPSENTYKLRLIASSLGLTHDNLYYLKNVKQDIIEVGKRMSREEQKLAFSCYLKQKLVSYKTLLNNSASELVLFRGLKQSIDNNEYEYLTSNLEPWTDDPYKARMFSGPFGIIIRKEFQPKNIFVYKKSVYKGTTDHPRNPMASRNINSENEYIVENTDRIIPLILDHTYFKASEL